MAARPLLLLAPGLLALALACGGGDATAPVGAAPPAPAAATPAPTAAAPTPAVAPTPGATAAYGVGSDGRPLYYDRALTAADVEGRTLRDLSLMRNTIFARVGNPFVKPWLNEHFRAQPWYTPLEKQDLSRLTEYDKANVALIADAENRASRDELVARRAKIRTQTTISREDAVELSLIGAALGEWSGDAAVPMEQRNPLEDPTVLDKQLTVAQIEGMSPRELRLLRNSIYARHGRPFKSPVLQMYFADKAWYQELPSYSDKSLTDIDKRNIQLVQSMEDRLGGPMKEWEHQREEGWFAGA